MKDRNVVSKRLQQTVIQNPAGIKRRLLLGNHLNNRPDELTAIGVPALQ